jgi:ribosomal protein S18 acetylase RimI-like enzyme
MPVATRPATEADLDILVEINRTVQTLHAALYPHDFKIIVDPSAVRAFLSARLATIAIAEIEGEPVGYIWFEDQLRPETPFTPTRPRLYVHHVAVSPHARRRGVGAALMDHVEQRAAFQGVEEIALDAWVANVEAKRFFRARGYLPLRLSLRKQLVVR